MAGKTKPKAQKADRATVVQRVDRTEAETMKNGYLDMLQSQAMDRFESLIVAAQFGAGAMDPSNEPVDGGKVWFEIPDHILEAHKRLGEASRHIGMVSYAIVYKFVIEGKKADQVAKDFSEAGERACWHYRRRFRDTLTELADLWYPVPASRKKSYHIRQEVISVNPEYWEKKAG